MPFKALNLWCIPELFQIEFLVLTIQREGATLERFHGVLPIEAAARYRGEKIDDSIRLLTYHASPLHIET